MASCAQAGMCKMNNLNASYIVDGRIHWNFIYDTVKHLCDGSEIELNADIVGSGVLASYIVQTVIAMYVWAFIMLPDILSAMGVIASFVSRVLRRFGFIARILTHRPSLIHWIRRTTLAHATTTFLAEFHEAQCYSIMSIEIALLYAKSRASYIGSNNWASLSEFDYFVRMIAMAGAWPVILTQTTLHRIRLEAIYYLALSTIALVLVTVAALTAVAPDIDDVYKLFKGQNMVSECGDNTSLRAFCLPRSNLPETSWFTGFFIFVTFLTGMLWVARLWKAIINISWLRNKYRNLTQRQQEKLAEARDIFEKASVLVFLITEGVAIAFLSLNMIDLVNLRRELDVGDWGIGQIIAVLVWAPVISKYLLLIIFVIEKGFVYRISQAFMVVRRPSEGESVDHGDTSSTDTPGANPDATSNATPLMRVRYA
ncbi:hypothetical protein NCS56_00370800 [Fusarium sp. Ph1]|nr:hypothetical protein NCS56_00370800 [Fusarium sp. Ph1]